MFRRRNRLNGRTLALEVAGPMLRMVAIEGAEGAERLQVQTRSVVWQREASDWVSEQGIEELGTAIRTLAAEEKLEGSKVTVTLGGAACFTWSMAGRCDEVRRALAGLEDRGSLYVTLGAGPKLAAASSHPLDSRREHLLVSIVHQKIVETLAGAVRQAGLVLTRLEPGLVSLSRLLGHLGHDRDAPAMILNLHDRGAELGVSYRGRLLLDYRPVAHVTAEAAAEAVIRHLDQIGRYCARQHSYATGPIDRIFLFGPSPQVRVVHDGLRRKKDLRVFARNSDLLDPRWRIDGAAQASEFGAALGCGLAADPSNALSAGQIGRAHV